MNKGARGWILVLLLVLSGCSEMKVEDFAHQGPALALEDYFAGDTYAWGMFQDRFGNVKRQFRVHIQGRWQAPVLTLDEKFRYDDGEQETRLWQIRKTGANAYSGSAGDVIGEAQGRTAGNALNWQYQLNLTVGDGHWKVHFDDWMWLQPGGTLINRANVSKWGVRLGTVTLFFSKQPGSLAPEAFLQAAPDSVLTP